MHKSGKKIEKKEFKIGENSIILKVRKFKNKKNSTKKV
jgi:hypothetical protein